MLLLAKFTPSHFNDENYLWENMAITTEIKIGLLTILLTVTTILTWRFSTGVTSVNLRAIVAWKLLGKTTNKIGRYVWNIYATLLACYLPCSRHIQTIQYIPCSLLLHTWRMHLYDTDHWSIRHNKSECTHRKSNCAYQTYPQHLDWPKVVHLFLGKCCCILLSSTLPNQIFHTHVHHKLHSE